MLKYVIYVLVLWSIQANAEVIYLNSEELIQAQNNGAVIIDIRTPQEWSSTGTIPKSHKIMFFKENRQPVVKEFLVEFQKLVTSKEQPFVLVCRSGARTGYAAKFLNEKLGYTQAAHLEKGMAQWIKENRDIEINK